TQQCVASGGPWWLSLHAGRVARRLRRRQAPIMTAVATPGTHSLSFERADDPSLAPGAMRLGYRDLFYHLVNVEEHPEVLPLAYDVAVQRLNAAAKNASRLGADLDQVIGHLSA